MAVDLEIARRLREARTLAGYETAAEAADGMDLTYGTYAGHENGTRGITTRSLIRYAAFFRVNLVWLMEGKPPIRGWSTDVVDILDGLPSEARQQAIEYIDFLKSKYGVSR